GPYSGADWGGCCPQTNPCAIFCGNSAVHMALLPTDSAQCQVLFWNVGGKAREWLFQPGAGASSGNVRDVPNKGSQIECGGHSALADGRLLVAGGTGSFVAPDGQVGLAAGVGLEHVNLYNPWAMPGQRWSRVGDLKAGRYYPTVTTLGSGE